MNINNEYEDDFFENREFDTIPIEEDYAGETSSNKGKSLQKKKKRLEDWLEEKRLRDELGEEPEF